MASKANYRQPRQVKRKPRNEKFSSRHCCHYLPTPTVVVPCFYNRCSLQASEPRETEKKLIEKKLGRGQVEELIEKAHGKTHGLG
nr:hypothetical protein CFP56_15770 [Quercus suber]